MRLYLIFSIFLSIFTSTKSFAAIRFTRDTTSISSFKKEKKDVTFSSKAMSKNVSKKTAWNIVWGGLAVGFMVFTKVASGEIFSGMALAAIMLLIVFLVRKGQKTIVNPNYETDIADSKSTKRSLKNLKTGMIFLGLGGLGALYGVLTAQGLSALLPFALAIGLGSVGFIFSLISLIQAIIAYKRQEPLRKKSLISIILFSVIFILPLVGLLANGLLGLL
jgi:hypothetical protein